MARLPRHTFVVQEQPILIITSIRYQGDQGEIRNPSSLKVLEELGKFHVAVDA